jgi:hypothetical protein
VKKPVAIFVGAVIFSIGVSRAASAGPLEDAHAAEYRYDYPTALKIIRPLAERGDPAAQTELADLYYDGKGVPQIATEAVNWYRRAALQGFPAAEHMLALCYEYGKGVVANEVEGVKWLRRAAEQGYAYSQYRLGQMYESPGNFGVPFGQDLIEAHKWYNLSAAGGDPAGERARTELETRMTPVQINEARLRAGGWKPQLWLPATVPVPGAQVQH